MNVDFYQNFSKKPNSTKRPIASGQGMDPHVQKSVVLKNPTSILNPVFILTGYDLTFNYVVWGSRYYFVDDIVIVHNDVAEYHCSVDVLATYKTQIGNSTQYVTRSASSYNEFLNDAIYPTRADSSSVTTLCDKLVCLESSTVILNQYGEYIIGIQNKNGSSHGGISYYAVSGSAMDAFLNFMFDDVSFLDATDISLELQKELVNPFQYICSLMWFPFEISFSSIAPNLRNLNFGFWEAPNTVQGCVVDYRNISFSKSVTLPEHPQAATRGKYLNSSPYTRHQLIFNSFGSIPIDPAYFVNSHTLAILCDVDLMTGTGILKLADSDGNIIFKTSGQVGVPCQISQVTQNMIGAGAAVLGGAVGLAYKNVVGFAQGIISGLENMMPQRQSTGSIGSTAAWEQQEKPYIVSTFYSQTAADATQLGRPLCAPTQIRNLSGYVQVDKADIAITGTEAEKQKIISFMEGGFFYE